MDIRITTHNEGYGQFSAKINGIPLIGQKGCVSRFETRKRAKEAAEERLSEMTEDEIQSFKLVLPE